MIYQINGADMPSPSGFEIEYIINGKAEMTAAGSTVMDRISTKRRLHITYNHLFLEQIQGLMKAAIRGDVFFDVSFVDPSNLSGNSAEMETSSFRLKDFRAPALHYENNMPSRFQNIKLTLEER